MSHLSTSVGHTFKIYSNTSIGKHAAVHLDGGHGNVSVGFYMPAAEARELAAALVMHADRIEPKGDGS